MSFYVLGIKFEISYIFASLIVLYIAFDRTGMFSYLLVSIIIHELSHLLFVYIFKSKIYSVRLIIGAISIEYSDFCDKYKRIITLLMGPISNLIIAAMSYYTMHEKMFAVNLVIAIYNMLPIKGLDGGSILLEVLVKFIDEQKANLALTIITMIIAIFGLIACVTIFKNNLSMIIIFIYIITPIIFKKILKDRPF